MGDEVKDEVQAPEVPDRRDAIEQAFQAAEAAASEASGAQAPASPAPAQASGEKAPAAPADAPAAPQPSDAAAVPQPSDSPAPDQLAVDKPPQSWRAPQKAKWATLDPEVKQEIVRREREIMKIFGDSGNARQFATQFHQTITPYMARIQSMGQHPLAAVQQLLKADHLLSTAPAGQRAKFMAQLIQDYGVDVRELDSALAGAGPADPVADRVETLLQQRLAPLQQFLQQQAQQQQQVDQQNNAAIGQTIQQMAANPAYPHFDAVREDMADIIEIASKRGLYLSLEDAYPRAVAMNPEVSKLVATQQQTQTQRDTAVRQNAAAQRALAASVSVSGAPSGLPSGTPVGSNRRAAIEAAFDSIGGR